jgi:hypothetical protein
VTGEPALRRADKRITYETLNRPHELFHFRFVFLNNVNKLGRAFAGIISDNCMHDIPPTLVDVHKTNAERLER